MRRNQFLSSERERLMLEVNSLNNEWKQDGEKIISLKLEQETLQMQIKELKQKI
jgi:hypothetical protein